MVCCVECVWSVWSACQAERLSHEAALERQRRDEQQRAGDELSACVREHAQELQRLRQHMQELIEEERLTAAAAIARAENSKKKQLQAQQQQHILKIQLHSGVIS